MSEKTINERICEAYDKGRKDGRASERESAAYLRGLNNGMAAQRETATKGVHGRKRSAEAWGALGGFLVIPELSRIIQFSGEENDEQKDD